MYARLPTWRPRRVSAGKLWHARRRRACCRRQPAGHTHTAHTLPYRASCVFASVPPVGNTQARQAAGACGSPLPARQARLRGTATGARARASLTPVAEQYTTRARGSCCWIASTVVATCARRQARLRGARRAEGALRS
jgi:hypothetical protein